MIEKLKHIIKLDLVRVFSLNAVATVIRMVAGFISIKVVAVLIGPSGVALLGQLNNFSSILLSISTGGINSGVTKYIAEQAGSQRKINAFLRTAFWITLTLSVLSALSLIFRSAFFSDLILKDVKYQPIMILFGLTIILYAFNSLLISVLNGYKQFKKYVQINIAGSILSLLFSVSLTVFFGVKGALIAAVTYQSITFVVTVAICTRCDWFKKVNFVGRYSQLAGNRLARYSLMALVGAATVPVSQLVVRSYLVQATSIESAGIWEGMNRISSMYLMVITTSLSVYYLPRLASLKTTEALRREIRTAYKIIIPPLLIGTVLIYLFRNLIVKILFNDSFLPMEELFAFQLTGDFFKISSWLVAYQMWAKSMTSLFVITEIISAISFLSLAILFVDLYGTIGASIAYAVNYLIYLAVMLIVFKTVLF